MVGNTIPQSIIAVRAYTVPPNKEKSYFEREILPELIKEYNENGKKATRFLFFDTETTIDHYQNLKFGYFEIWENNSLEKFGLFYDPNTLKTKESVILRNYSTQNTIPLFTITEYRKIFLHEVWSLETFCVGFNLPFDLTRIALSATPARKKPDTFSLKLSNEQIYPRLRITHVSNTLSFIKWGNPRIKHQKSFKGYFLDLRTLSHALTDKKHSLESACAAFRTKYQKYKSIQHGKVTSDYIKYCINDVKATQSLYIEMKKEFDSYQLNIPVNNAYTPASIGKEILKKIGVKSFFDKNGDFSPEILGNIMNGYFGGRTENKIRKKPTMVDLLDFLSMYPTVCVLQELWRFVIAKKIRHQDATDEIIKLVDNINLKDIQSKETWKKLPVMVLVEPTYGDVFPVRSKFEDKLTWNIGMCSVSSPEPIWWSLADVIASKLVSGRTPKILRAIKFIPEGVQSGLKNIEIQGIKINPYKQDLFKELIQYRKQLKNSRDSYSKTNPKYDYYKRLQNVVKIIANAVSYGIFVEINTTDVSKPVTIDVYGSKHFQNDKTRIEKAGFMFNPIIAVAITSASRLLLATTEVLLAKHGETYAYCDTDSMAIPPKYSKEIQRFFTKLNPYNFEAEIFEKERENVWFYGISSKRYCLYTRDEKGKIIIDDEKFSAHGLGQLLDPFKTDPNDESMWHKELWEDILKLHYKMVLREELIEKYEKKYPIMLISISTPTIHNRFKKDNKERDYYHQIKPRNFALLGFANKLDEKTGESIKPFAPYQDPARYAVYDKFVDYNNKDGGKLQGEQYWKSLWTWIDKYLEHPEGKFEGKEGILQRRHLVVGRVLHIGKESEDLETPLDENSYVIYTDKKAIESKFVKNIDRILEAKPKDLKGFDVSKQTLWNVQNKIRTNQLNRISTKIKIRLLKYFDIL